MSRKRFAVLPVALVAGFGLHLAGAGTASSATLSTFWDSATPGVGVSQSWTYGSASWNCDLPYTGDGYDVTSTYVGATWNDRYSSGNTGNAQCSVDLFQNADLIGRLQTVGKAPVSDTPRPFTLSSANNQVSSLGWS